MRYNLNFLVLQSFFYVYFLKGKTLIYMVSNISSLTLLWGFSGTESPSNLIGPWKKKNLSEFGIVTQCIAPLRVNDQYLTNVLLKINAKVSNHSIIFLCFYSPDFLLNRIALKVLNAKVYGRFHRVCGFIIFGQLQEGVYSVFWLI